MPPTKTDSPRTQAARNLEGMSTDIAPGIAERQPELATAVRTLPERVITLRDQVRDAAKDAREALKPGAALDDRLREIGRDAFSKLTGMWRPAVDPVVRGLVDARNKLDAPARGIPGQQEMSDIGRDRVSRATALLVRLAEENNSDRLRELVDAAGRGDAVLMVGLDSLATHEIERVEMVAGRVVRDVRRSYRAEVAPALAQRFDDLDLLALRLQANAGVAGQVITQAIGVTDAEAAMTIRRVQDRLAAARGQTEG